MTIVPERETLEREAGEIGWNGISTLARRSLLRDRVPQTHVGPEGSDLCVEKLSTQQFKDLPEQLRKYMINHIFLGI